MQARRQRLEAAIGTISQLIQQDRLPEAYRLLVAASRMPMDGGLRSQLISMVNDLQTAAGKWIDQADQFYQNEKFLDALEKYQAVASMRQLKVARTALEKLNASEQDPRVDQARIEMRAADMWAKVQAVLHGESEQAEDDSDAAIDQTLAGAPQSDCAVDGSTAAGAESSAASQLDKALDAPTPAADTRSDVDLAMALAMGDRVRLINLLDDLQRQYAQTAAGQKAAQFHQQLAADSFMQEVANHRDQSQARQQYQMASLYLKAGKRDMAVDLFRRIIANWPDTDWATKAQASLRQAGEAF